MKKRYSFYTSYEDFGDAVNALSGQMDISSLKLQQVAAEIQETASEEKLQQVVAEIPFPAIFGFIPWGHHIEINIDKLHPRKSICNYAFAKGRRVVCKHMIALYFTAEPEAAQNFLKQSEQWEHEEEERVKQHYEDLQKYVKSLSKAELQERLYNALIELEERRNRYW